MDQLPLELWVIIVRKLDARSVLSVSSVNRRLKAAARLAAPETWRSLERIYANQFGCSVVINDEDIEAGSTISSLFEAEKVLSSKAIFWRKVERIDAGVIRAFDVVRVSGDSYILVAHDDRLFRVHNPENGEIVFSLSVENFFHSDFTSLFLPTRRQIATLPRISRRERTSSFICVYGQECSMQSPLRLESLDRIEGTCQVRGFVWKGGVVAVFRSSGGFWSHFDSFSGDGESPMESDLSLQLGDALDVLLREDYLVHLHRRLSGIGAAYRYVLRKTGLRCGVTQLLVRLAYPSNSPSASLVEVPLGPAYRFIARRSQCGVVEGRIHDSGGIVQMDGRGRLCFGVFGQALSLRASVPDLAPNDFYAGGRWYAARSSSDSRAFYITTLLGHPWHLSF